MNPPKPVRRYVRHRADFRVKLFFRLDGGMQSAVVRTYELSAGGLSIYAPMELPSNEEVLLEFALPGVAEAIRVGASVRNRMGFRYGMEFESLTFSQRAAIQSFCEGLPAAE